MTKQFLYAQTLFICMFIATNSLAQNSSIPPQDLLTTVHTNAAAACYTCHSEDEPHEGVFGQDCSRCHTTKGWEQRGFDHGLTRFPLIGVHTELDCDSCHQQAPNSTATRGCQDCHRDDDPHDQHLSQNCARCHNPNGWEHWQFDHNRQTSFPLQGAHQDLECIACHTTPVNMEFDIPQNCVNCHRQDDQHRGDFGLNCHRCHQPTDFKDVKMPN